jgi:hypothetical protein
MYPRVNLLNVHCKHLGPFAQENFDNSHLECAPFLFGLAVTASAARVDSVRIRFPVTIFFALKLRSMSCGAMESSVSST